MDKEVVPLFIYLSIHTNTHIQYGILLSHKKEWNNATCSNMNGPRDYHIILSEVNQTEKDKYHMISLTCGIWKKRHKWTYLQNRNRPTDIENKLTVTKRERGEG